jgi:hypothetical protein
MQCREPRYGKEAQGLFRHGDQEFKHPLQREIYAVQRMKNRRSV